MQTLRGIAVSPGVATGEALIIDHEGFRIPRHFVTHDAVDDELQRLDRAIQAVATQIAAHRDTVNRRLGEHYGAIFAAHLQMLHDPQLRAELESLVATRHFSPEFAVSRVFRRYAKVFQELDSPHLAERSHDLLDIEKRLLGNLLGRRREELDHLQSPVVVLAHDLTPSEAAMLDRRYVLGFVTETGGAGGHTSIVAKGLEIPAVVGTGEFLLDVSGGDRVIVDGDQGLVILQPDDETLARYRHEQEEHRVMLASLECLRELPAETQDGTRIQINANIEFPWEAEVCRNRGADGIGLYRTEFLYLGRQQEPTEEDHYRAYAQVIEALGDRPIVIRTLDLGADKLGQVAAAAGERNPFLGMRSIRMSLRNLPLFRTQLRAVLRASAVGRVQVMFPLITTLQELRQAKMVLADTMEDLEEAGQPFDSEIPVGMMVEVPAAVMMLDQFLREVDFVSIGTNDLTQYTLAVDRSNSQVAAYYHDSDPAVLRMIKLAVDAAAAGGRPVSLCGQMSADPRYTMLLLGLGLRALSTPPAAIPEIKRICRSVTLAQCQALARRVMSLENALEIDRFVGEELKRVVPPQTVS